MSYFVTITFDLNCAKSVIYPKIYANLEGIDFSKFLKGKKKIETQLPSNTFVAEFDEDGFENGKELREWLKIQIKGIFNYHNVSGKYFIAIGKKWSWVVGNVIDKHNV